MFFQLVNPEQWVVGRTFETCSFFESIIVFSGYMCCAHKNLCLKHIVGEAVDFHYQPKITQVVMFSQ